MVTKQRDGFKILLAFLLGTAVMWAFMWYRTENLRNEAAQLQNDLAWAVQRGVTLEAYLIMCREGLKNRER